LKIIPKNSIYILPTILICLFFLIESFFFHVHDFGNSYFSSRLLLEEGRPEWILFDIQKFNEYVWSLGYENELLDYYLNSPFTLFLFYPFAFVKNAFLAKGIFNTLSIIGFLYGIILLKKWYLKDSGIILSLLPVLFLTPIRSHILAGQSYFLILILIIYGYYRISNKNKIIGGTALGLAALLKFFPAFYGLPLLFSRQWKTIFWGVLITAGFTVLAISITGLPLWKHYFLEILPKAIEYKSTIDFRPNYQSFDVFFKTLFIRDSYYNPEALFDNEKFYQVVMWIIRAIVLGAALYLSLLKRKESFQLLCVWVVALFLLQPRTGIYAQILWIIPACYMLKSNTEKYIKLSFFGILFLVCNFPFHWLSEMPLGIRFMRLWLTVILAVIFYLSLTRRFNIWHIIITFVLMIPLNVDVFKSTSVDVSNYVLEKKKHFLIGDFYSKNNVLNYVALGRNGKKAILTKIVVRTFDTNRCYIKNDQIFLDNVQLTFTKSLKKKAVLVNDCEVYFLSDFRSRRGAFTLKKIDLNTVK